jgi:hypothetical protein
MRLETGEEYPEFHLTSRGYATEAIKRCEENLWREVDDNNNIYLVRPSE